MTTHLSKNVQTVDMTKAQRLVLADRSLVVLAIRRTLARLIGNRERYQSDEGRRGACKNALLAARKLYGWGDGPCDKGSDFTAEGWHAYAQAIQIGQTNREWKISAERKAAGEAVADEMVRWIDRAVARKEQAAPEPVVVQWYDEADRKRLSTFDSRELAMAFISTKAAAAII